jgi:aminopeptidase N
MKYLFTLFVGFRSTKKSVFQISFGSINSECKREIYCGFGTLLVGGVKPNWYHKIDAQNMSFTAVKLNDMPVPYLNTAKQLQIIYSFKKVKMKLVLNSNT